MKCRRRRISLLLIAAIATAPFTALAQTPSGSPPQPTIPAPPSQGAGKSGAQGTPAWMSPRMEEARTRYTRGLKLYDEGNTIAARVEFERAYELAPSYRILYNIGLCYKKTNDYVEALKAFERYLLDGGDEVPEERRTAVNKEIQDLRPNIATVTITTNVPGAAITVDDVPVGQTPIPQKILVNPGRRRIAATKAGYFPQTKSLVFAGSDVEQLSIELIELPKREIAQREEKSVAPYVAWGITGALATGAVVTGLLALKANSDQNDALDRQAANARTQIDDAHSKTRTLSIVADALTAATVVAGGISLYLTLHKPEKSNSAQAAARVTPGGVSIVGRF
ncbi:PEGA domain-containing protein [Pendulispora rubella]|uniref:PEGA domain-containing protein n=1 Tax=Pendulispora rubella TaxID=2741070 RepID=A0ABZ2LF43_9BACT